jgi:S1-C subfamily serine protease
MVLPGFFANATASNVADAFSEVKSSVVVVRVRERVPDPNRLEQLVVIEGTGSGVYIGNRRVVTASHVVQTSDVVEVEFTSGEAVAARVLASEPSADVALLELAESPREGRSARLGDSSEARIGEQVFVVGAPLGVSHTLTVGHLSARRAGEILFGDFSEAVLLQTDASINPGNSGGPMFNLEGEVIGIVSAILSRSGGSEGLGFAVSSNTVRALLIEQRSLWSGLEGILVTGDLAQALNLPQPTGLLVQRVAEGSPADLLGLRPGSVPAVVGEQALLLGGDVILSVQGIALADEALLRGVRRTLRSLAPGSKIELEVLRAGRVEHLEGRLGQ